MSSASSTGHGPHSTSGATSPDEFNPAEVDSFRSEDGSAATAIVGLMAGIFTVGLLGYIVVALWTKSTGKM